MRINVGEAQKRIEYLAIFEKQRVAARLKTALLRFFMIFSNFEAILGEQKDLLHDNSTSPFNSIDSSFVDIAFEFFQKRYLTNGELNEKFTKHLFRKNDDEDKVGGKIAPIIKDTNASETDKIKAVYGIAYRFRDNLLHGNEGKETTRLQEYECCFCKINDFMFQLMEQLIAKELRK